MTTLSITALIAGITVFASVWRQIFSTVISCKNYLIGKIDVDPYLSNVIYTYCVCQMKMIGIRDKTYYGGDVFCRTNSRQEIAAFDVLNNNTIWFRKGFKLLVISKGPKYIATDNYTQKQGLSIVLPRLIWNPEKFIKEATEFYAKNIKKEQENRFRIDKKFGRNEKEGISLIGGSGTSAAATDHNEKVATTSDLLDRVHNSKAILVTHKINDIVNDINDINVPFEFFPYPIHIINIVNKIKQWYEQKNTYIMKGIPWRKGILITGKPGSGKTMLTKCLAKELKIPLVLFDIATMNNQEFSCQWSETVMYHSPCLILIEDIDSVFEGRKTINGKLTFDAFINAISGVASSEGILLCITSNNPDKLDSAISSGGLVTRPGRIDHIITLNEMAEECRTKYASRILDIPASDPKVVEIVIKGDGLTAAQFNELCLTELFKNEK